MAINLEIEHFVDCSNGLTTHIMLIRQISCLEELKRPAVKQSLDSVVYRAINTIICICFTDLLAIQPSMMGCKCAKPLAPIVGTTREYMNQTSLLRENLQLGSDRTLISQCLRRESMHAQLQVSMQLLGV